LDGKAMKRAMLLLIFLLAGCGIGDGDDSAGLESRQPVQTADLTGLYEAPGEGRLSARMCMISDPSGTASFAIVTETPGGGCGGAGEAVREAGLLRLTMAGDEECVIEARMEGRQVTFPQSLPQGCAYYCAPGVTLAGADFEKTGGTAEDAMRAADLAGDPLCG
jgi:hypothetical protein